MDRTEMMGEGLTRLGIAWEDSHLDKLCLFLDEIKLWNSDSRRDKKGLSLVRAEGEDLVVKHVLDSLAGLPVVLQFPHDRIADIGSGAGFPGIPFAIFLPDSKITLVERSGRKAAFLRNAAACLGLVHVEVQNIPMEQVTGQFDVVVFRALKRIEAVLDNLLPITAPGGIIAAYKGRKSEVNDEIRAVPDCRAEVYPLDVPFLKDERNLVLLRVNSIS